MTKSGDSPPDHSHVSNVVSKLSKFMKKSLEDLVKAPTTPPPVKDVAPVKDAAPAAPAGGTTAGGDIGGGPAMGRETPPPVKDVAPTIPTTPPPVKDVAPTIPTTPPVKDVAPAGGTTPPAPGPPPPISEHPVQPQTPEAHPPNVGPVAHIPHTDGTHTQVHAQDHKLHFTHVDQNGKNTVSHPPMDINDATHVNDREGTYHLTVPSKLADKTEHAAVPLHADFDKASATGGRHHVSHDVVSPGVGGADHLQEIHGHLNEGNSVIVPAGEGGDKHGVHQHIEDTLSAGGDLGFEVTHLPNNDLHLTPKKGAKGPEGASATEESKTEGPESKTEGPESKKAKTNLQHTDDTGYLNIDGWEYEGTHINNQAEGNGKFNHPDGHTMEGEFKGGQPHGQAEIKLADGQKRVGEFKDGELHNGTHTEADGTATEFKNGNPVETPEPEPEAETPFELTSPESPEQKAGKTKASTLPKQKDLPEQRGAEGTPLFGGAPKSEAEGTEHTDATPGAGAEVKDADEAAPETRSASELQEELGTHGFTPEDLQELKGVSDETGHAHEDVLSGTLKHLEAEGTQHTDDSGPVDHDGGTFEGAHKDGVPHEGKITYGDDGSTFEGKFTEDGGWHTGTHTDSDGTVTEHKDGDTVGRTSFHPNGEKRSEGPLVDGERDGAWRHYKEDGSTDSTGEWEGGTAHGQWTHFHPSGGISQEGEYRNHEKVGEHRYYDENGAHLQSDFHNEDGTLNRSEGPDGKNAPEAGAEPEAEAAPEGEEDPDAFKWKLRDVLGGDAPDTPEEIKSASDLENELKDLGISEEDLLTIYNENVPSGLPSRGSRYAIPDDDERLSPENAADYHQALRDEIEKRKGEAPEAEAAPDTDTPEAEAAPEEGVAPDDPEAEAAPDTDTPEAEPEDPRDPQDMSHEELAERAIADENVPEDIKATLREMPPSDANWDDKFAFIEKMMKNLAEHHEKNRNKVDWYALGKAMMAEDPFTALENWYGAFKQVVGNLGQGFKEHRERKNFRSNLEEGFGMNVPQGVFNKTSSILSNAKPGSLGALHGDLVDTAGDIDVWNKNVHEGFQRTYADLERSHKTELAEAENSENPEARKAAVNHSYAHALDGIVRKARIMNNADNGAFHPHKTATDEDHENFHKVLSSNVGGTTFDNKKEFFKLVNSARALSSEHLNELTSILDQTKDKSSEERQSAIEMGIQKLTHLEQVNQNAHDLASAPKQWGSSGKYPKLGEYKGPQTSPFLDALADAGDEASKLSEDYENLVATRDDLQAQVDAAAQQAQEQHEANKQAENEVTGAEKQDTPEEGVEEAPEEEVAPTFGEDLNDPQEGDASLSFDHALKPDHNVGRGYRDHNGDGHYIRSKHVDKDGTVSYLVERINPNYLPGSPDSKSQNKFLHEKQSAEKLHRNMSSGGDYKPSQVLWHGDHATNDRHADDSYNAELAEIKKRNGSPADFNSATREQQIRSGAFSEADKKYGKGINSDQNDKKASGGTRTKLANPKHNVGTGYVDKQGNEFYIKDWFFGKDGEKDFYKVESISEDIGTNKEDIVEVDVVDRRLRDDKYKGKELAWHDDHAGRHPEGHISKEELARVDSARKAYHQERFSKKDAAAAARATPETPTGASNAQAAGEASSASSSVDDAPGDTGATDTGASEKQEIADANPVDAAAEKTETEVTPEGVEETDVTAEEIPGEEGVEAEEVTDDIADTAPLADDEVDPEVEGAEAVEEVAQETASDVGDAVEPPSFEQLTELINNPPKNNKEKSAAAKERGYKKWGDLTRDHKRLEKEKDFSDRVDTRQEKVASHDKKAKELAAHPEYEQGGSVAKAHRQHEAASEAWKALDDAPDADKKDLLKYAEAATKRAEKLEAEIGKPDDEDPEGGPEGGGAPVEPPEAHEVTSAAMSPGDAKKLAEEKGGAFRAPHYTGLNTNNIETLENEVKLAQGGVLHLDDVENINKKAASVLQATLVGNPDVTVTWSSSPDITEAGIKRRNDVLQTISGNDTREFPGETVEGAEPEEVEAALDGLAKDDYNAFRNTAEEQSAGAANARKRFQALDSLIDGIHPQAAAAIYDEQVAKYPGIAEYRDKFSYGTRTALDKFSQGQEKEAPEEGDVTGADLSDHAKELKELYDGRMSGEYDDKYVRRRLTRHANKVDLKDEDARAYIDVLGTRTGHDNSAQILRDRDKAAPEETAEPKAGDTGAGSYEKPHDQAVSRADMKSRAADDTSYTRWVKQGDRWNIVRTDGTGSHLRGYDPYWEGVGDKDTHQGPKKDDRGRVQAYFPQGVDPNAKDKPKGPKLTELPHSDHVSHSSGAVVSPAELEKLPVGARITDASYAHESPEKRAKGTGGFAYYEKRKDGWHEVTLDAPADKYGGGLGGSRGPLKDEEITLDSPVIDPHKDKPAEPSRADRAKAKADEAIADVEQSDAEAKLRAAPPGKKITDKAEIDQTIGDFFGRGAAPSGPVPHESWSGKKNKEGTPTGKGQMVFQANPGGHDRAFEGTLDNSGRMKQGRLYIGTPANRIIPGTEYEDIPNGPYYEGAFKDGVPHGKGLLHFGNGVFEEGTFENNELVEGRSVRPGFEDHLITRDSPEKAEDTEWSAPEDPSQINNKISDAMNKHLGERSPFAEGDADKWAHQVNESGHHKVTSPDGKVIVSPRKKKNEEYYVGHYTVSHDGKDESHKTFGAAMEDANKKHQEVGDDIHETDAGPPTPEDDDFVKGVLEGADPNCPQGGE